MDEKIVEVKRLINGISCSEAIFILNNVLTEVEEQKREKSKEIVFKI